MDFNILCISSLNRSVLEELHLGLPWEAWKMAGLVVAIIVFVLKVASPRLLRRIEQEFARRQKQDE